MQSVFHFIPKVLRGVEVRDLSTQFVFFHLSESKPCFHGAHFVYCHAGTGLGYSVPVKGNIQGVYKNTLYNRVLHVGANPHKVMMVTNFWPYSVSVTMSHNATPQLKLICF